MPSSSPDLQSPYGHFDLITRVKLDYTDVTVSKWQSRKSGLTVVHLDYEAPIVKGYFVVGTEIFNDSGCPHTLEHLVFLGSEKYPYKGVLDNLANRAFANGTNAWTAVDHTAYTIETAGEQGFLQLLPIYVDHILYPTITDAGFTTEVHHIDPQGEDAGVVYSEMQGRENTSGDIAQLESQRLFFPPNSAYRSETGGLMEALRKLTVEEIRQYHSSYYVPHNLALVVAGKLSTQALLDTIQSTVEPSIEAHKHANGLRPQGWKRPFMETPSADVVKITEGKVKEIEFPEKDESLGEVTLSFVGPVDKEYGDKFFLIEKAIDMLGTYLTDSAVSPLTRAFVEIPSPLCTYVYFAESGRAWGTTLDVYFGSVPVDELKNMETRFKDELRKIIKEGIDMERIALVLKRERLKLSNDLESDGGDYFSGTVISDFLYGSTNGKDLIHSLGEAKLFEELSTWTAQQWAEVLDRFYISNPSVTVLARPSASLATSLESTETARVAAQREALGPEGLAKMEKLLNDAKAEHDKPIPDEILTDFKVPDVNRIGWIEVGSARNNPTKAEGLSVSRSSGDAPNTRSQELERYLQADGKDLPFFIQFDHVKSDFVTISAYLSTTSVPDRLKPYIGVYLSSFFSLPITRASTSTRLSHEEVVKQLDNTTVAYDINLGVGGYYSELVRAALKLETKTYEEGIAWLKDLMWGSEWDLERLAVTIAKIQQGLPELKRDGNSVVSSVSGRLLFDETSSAQAGALMTQLDFIPKLAQALKDDPEKVVKDLEELRQHLLKPESLRFSVTGNVMALKEPRSAWNKHFGKLPSATLLPVPWASKNLSVLGKNPIKKAVVVTLPTIESSFAIHTTKTISGFDHPAAAELRLACEVLDGTESFLWKYIRGSGLAYGANMSLDLEAGLLSLSLYRSPNSFIAFQEAAKVVRGLADGSIELKETALDAAKSSLVYGIARSVGTPARAATTSFTNQVLKDVEQDYGRVLLSKLQTVTLTQVRDAIRTHILPLFDSTSSVAVVVSSPTRAPEIGESLGGVGFEVESRTLDVSPEEMEVDESGSEFDDGSSDASEIPPKL